MLSWLSTRTLDVLCVILTSLGCVNLLICSKCFFWIYLLEPSNLCCLFINLHLFPHLVLRYFPKLSWVLYNLLKEPIYFLFSCYSYELLFTQHLFVVARYFNWYQSKVSPCYLLGLTTKGLHMSTLGNDRNQYIPMDDGTHFFPFEEQDGDTSMHGNSPVEGFNTTSSILH
jgi:hypothetical protein